MAYAFITEIKNLKKHSNADRLQVGECFGNQVIVSLEVTEGQIGVYFATDSQLSEEYSIENDLLRRKDEYGNQAGGYLEPQKRNIRALKLRGEISDGLFMPIESLSAFTNISKLKIGDCVDTIDGKLICQKYIPVRKIRELSTSKKTKGKKNKEKAVEFPIFEEHIDTSQYAYNKHVFKEGDIITLSLKLHGTSGRTSNTIKRQYLKPTIVNKILVKTKLKKPSFDSYGVVTGTRRVVLSNFDGGYYGSDIFRKKYHDGFEGKLKEGETIYYEIVGYTDSGSPIMSVCDNKATGDKEFIKKYGKETTFSYGCNVGENEIYVYRMSLTLPNGDVFEYPTWMVKQRCREMDIKVVPILDQFIFTNIEDLDKKMNELAQGVDPIGLVHIKEGVVARIENRVKFTVYKHKSFEFKVLEGIIKDLGIMDMEEEESLKLGEDGDEYDC